MQKKNWLLFILALWLCAISAWSGTIAATDIPQSRPSLSSQARISVITQWPGAEIYLSWGHSAIRVSDPAQGLDRIFNYGTFGVEDPLFIPRFVYGELDYYLSEYDFNRYFEYDVQTQHRIWEEQILNLTQEQTNRLYQFLAWNAKAENAVYRYDFIRDNCSTRILDALERILGPHLQLNARGLANSHESSRDLIDHGVNRQPAWQFMFYLVVGSAADAPTSLRQATWSPAYLEAALAEASVVRDGLTDNLVASTRRLYEPALPNNYDSPLWNPAFLLWPLAAMALGLTVWRLSQHWKSPIAPAAHPALRAADSGLFFLVGLLGCIVFFLVFFSSHSAVKGNLNLVWMWPLHLVAAFLIGRKSLKSWLWPYFSLAALMCLLPLLLWPIWPQAQHPTMVPLLLILGSRSAWHGFRAWKFRQVA